MSQAPDPRPLSLVDLAAALAEGWHVFRRCQRFSLAFGALFAAIGTALIWGAQALGLAPMTPALVGGFLLVGPLTMAALIAAAEGLHGGGLPSLATMAASLRNAPRGLWALALFCVLMYFIWLTDAGTLYSFMVGEARSGIVQALPLSRDTGRFQLFSAAMGLVLANVVFAVTVHSVPLMVRHHTPLVAAVTASVRALFRSPLAHAAWALLLTSAIVTSLLLPPLLCVSLPLLGYAGEALSKNCFPGGAMRL